MSHSLKLPPPLLLYYLFTETFKVLTSTLAAPRMEFTLRALNEEFVQTLQQEILLRPLSFGKPLVALVRGLKDPNNFREEELDTCVLEVIGGNHRREALTNLMSMSENNGSDTENYKFVDVQLFCG